MKMIESYMNNEIANRVASMLVLIDDDSARHFAIKKLIKASSEINSQVSGSMDELIAVLHEMEDIIQTHSIGRCDNCDRRTYLRNYSGSSGDTSQCLFGYRK